MTRNEPGDRNEPENRNQPEEHSGALERMAAWLDARLKPTLGPPPIGPYEDVEASPNAGDPNAVGPNAGGPDRSVADACPLCEHPMSQHRIDRSHANAVLICPVPPKPEEQSYEPLNEVGMPKKPR